jgi:hypothetical protein
VISNSALGVREALLALRPRMASLVADAGANGHVHFLLQEGDELWASDVGAVGGCLTMADIPMPDEAVAQAICAEHGAEWLTGGLTGPWVRRRVGLQESLAKAVDEVEAAIAGLLTAARFRDVLRERGKPERSLLRGDEMASMSAAGLRCLLDEAV